MTSVLCKICENIIKKRGVEDLGKEKNIVKTELEFGKGKLCVTNLLYFYSRAIDMVRESEGWLIVFEKWF